MPGMLRSLLSSLNGDQTASVRAPGSILSRDFPSTANNHSGHNHDGVSHRILREINDLNQDLISVLTYFGEAVYLSPHEFTLCQSHPGHATCLTI